VALDNEYMSFMAELGDGKSNTAPVSTSSVSDAGQQSASNETPDVPSINSLGQVVLPVANLVPAKKPQTIIHSTLLNGSVMPSNLTIPHALVTSSSAPSAINIDFKPTPLYPSPAAAVGVAPIAPVPNPQLGAPTWVSPVPVIPVAHNPVSLQPIPQYPNQAAVDYSNYAYPPLQPNMYPGYYDPQMYGYSLQPPMQQAYMPPSNLGSDTSQWPYGQLPGNNPSNSS
jgi:hypothetical protein